ncbi:hypothetical protein FOA43_004317 [Brettanomyces nanus]|uniref:Uncharacterized protein n=1 Tax=Eeniella nana TaxID=13502 RepID=A0A875S7N6_EENNA|nr:uncharacterized protein FOA43_004317 [Brettanomyces nanus]QPG76923.1 hypothetical protein FOA43_004317 [Brettanomyces nanus]
MDISFLGGRMFFKNLLIITQNEIILVHQGWFTWRYWLFHVRRPQLMVEEQKLSANTNEKLPTRYLLEISGLEIFLFNRTQAYNGILEKLKSESSDSTLHNRKQSSSTKLSSDTLEADDESLYREKTMNEQEEVVDSPFLNLLPMAVHVNKGSLIMGNETTPSLLVVYCSSLFGCVDACRPASTLDYFRTSFDFDTTSLQAYLKPNVSYKKIDELAKEMKKFTTSNEARDNFVDRWFGSVSRRFDLWKVHHQKKKNEKEAKKKLKNADKLEDEDQYDTEWHGLERYLTHMSFKDDSPINPEVMDEYENMMKFSASEYARYTHILETTNAKVSYFYDSPGLVPPAEVAAVSSDCPDVGNGGPPPGTGIDISVLGGNFHYGPWADRQRGSLQSLIFPPICRDSEPFQKLRPGMRRQYTDFKISIECDDDTVIQIPHREPSKDADYQKIHVNGVRPFGWMEIKTGKGSTVDISTSYIPSADKGFDNKLQVSLKRVEMSTSVNHDIVYRATGHKITASVGYPLKWNGEAEWTFENKSKNAQLYLLREHVALCSDLFRDFSSGDPTPYEYFRPFLYKVNWQIRNYAIYLNVNEGNIVDNPLDHANNVYFSLKGKQLDIEIGLPLETIYRKSTDVSFNVFTDKFVLSLEAPPWSTISNFMDTPEIGKSFNFKMTGSYIYYTSVEIDSMDTIIINCTCSDTTLECYGFFIKYFLYLKENYFGDQIHFQTLSEFTEKSMGRQSTSSKNDSARLLSMPKVKNETDLFFSFCVTNGCIVLPVHLYDCGSFIGIHFESLDIDIRINGYYMDMQTDFSPALINYFENAGHMDIFEYTRLKQPFSPDMKIDGLSIHGHRMFGLPPDELTYFCRWAFDSGAVSIDSDGSFANSLMQSISCLKFGYGDLENSLQKPLPSVMDIINLTFVAPSVHLKLHGLDYVLDITLSPVSYKLSDQSTLDYNKRIDLEIKEITVKSFREKLEILNMTTSFYLTDFVQKRDGAQRRLKQLRHVRFSDGPFHRSPFFLTEEFRTRKYKNEYLSIFPSISLPDVPEPYLSSTMDLLIQGYPDDFKQRLETTYNDIGDNSVEENAFTPQRIKHFQANDLDPQCEYDNIVLSFGKVTAFMLPEAFAAFSDILMGSANFSIYRVTDSLEIDVFNYLCRSHLPSKVNYKFECPGISLRMGEENSSIDHLDFQLLSPSLTLSSSKTSDDEDASGELHVNASIAEFKMQATHDDKEAFQGVLYSFTLKYSEFSSTKLIKLNLGDFIFSLNAQEMNWLYNYCVPLIARVSSFLDYISIAERNKRKAKMEFVYKASMAGVSHKIVHDPPCITKPSYVTRFTEDHTRLQNSWRIMTRLRHVMKNLPEDWHQRENAVFKTKKWEAPESAQEEVFNVFLNWRQWECQNIEGSYILQHVFALEESNKNSKPLSLEMFIRHCGLNLGEIKDIIMLSELRLDFHQNKLVEEVRARVKPLIKADIDDGIDIRVEVGSCATKLADLRHSMTEFLTFIKAIYNVIDQMNEAKRNCTDDVNVVDAAGPPDEKLKPTLITMHLVLTQFKNDLSIDRTKVSFFGRGGMINISAIKNSAHLLALTMSSSVDLQSILVSSGTIRLIDYHCEAHTFAITVAGDIKSGNRTISISNKKITLQCAPGSEGLTRAIDYFIKYEYLIIQPLLEFMGHKLAKEDILDTKVPPLTEDNSNTFQNIRGKFSIDINVAKMLLELEIFSPLLYTADVDDIQFSIIGESTGLIGSLNLNRFATKISSRAKNYEYEYAYCTLDKIKAIAGIRPDSGRYNAYVKISLGNGRAQLAQNDLVQIILKAFDDSRQVQANYLLLDKKVQRFICLIRLQTPLAQESSVPLMGPIGSRPTAASKLMGFLRVYFSLDCDALGIATRINDNQIVLDSSNLSVNLDSFDPVSLVNRLSGKIDLPSTKIIFASATSQAARFPIFDINLSLDIVNPQIKDHKLQQMILSSEYCRIVLNPYYANRMLDIYAEMRWCFSKIKQNCSIAHTNSAATPDAFQTILSFFAIKISAKNLCVGWLFSPNEKYYSMQYIRPGVIFGFENSEIICAKAAGRMSVYGMYTSLAHGNGPTNFYPTKSERTSENRAYFPTFKLVYAIVHEEGRRHMQAKVDGDMIDFKLQTPVLLVSEPLGSSLLRLQTKLSGLQPTQKPEATLSNHRNDTQQNLHQFLGIDSFNCILRFDGANFAITNSNIEVNGQTAALHMQAPKMSTVLKWTHKEPPANKNMISIVTSISRTDNSLTCLCVPVLTDVIGIFRDFMRSNGNKLVVSSKLTDSGVGEPDTSFEWQKVMKSITFNFMLKVEPQRLKLSCEPRANVAAEVSCDEIHIVVSSDSDSISGLLYVGDLSAALRHAYSKEASASFSVNNLILNATMADICDVKQFSIVCKIDELKALVNIQQRQDLDVFRDVWFPGQIDDLGMVTKEIKNARSPKTFASVLREVSSTSAFPWTWLLLIKKVQVQLHLGSSLGILSGHIDNTWVVSKKATNWDQNVRFQSDKLCLESEGRLGGTLNVEGIRVASMISWKKDGAVLDVPRVMLSVGINLLQAKVSLDFHPFLILDARSMAVGIFNQRSQGQLDKLAGTVSIESLKVFITALAASNLVDIYTIGLRIRQEIHISYRQVLNDNKNKQSHNNEKIAHSDEEAQSRTVSETFLRVIQKLRTDLDFRIGGLEIQVLPSSLTDSRVLVLRIGSAKSSYSQNNTNRLESQLHVNFKNAIVALSSYRHKPSEQLLEKGDVSAYVDVAGKASGGNIFVLPSLSVDMGIWVNFGSNLVNYTYNLSFGDKVDVRWNLGSVYFIRQMWYTHASALRTRLKALRIFNSDEFGGNFEENYKESILETVNVEDRLKDAELDEKYVYVSIEDAHIETPQLRDLGNATPPLEWFGLHRKKFPNLTHQTVILSLQKMIEKVEETYSKVLH